MQQHHYKLKESQPLIDYVISANEADQLFRTPAVIHGISAPPCVEPGFRKYIVGFGQFCLEDSASIAREPDLARLVSL